MVEKLSNLIRSAFQKLSQFQWVGLLMVRFTLAIIFLQTGYGKLAHIAKTTAFFAELGIPYPLANAWVASLAEFICAGLIAVGLATRFAAVTLIVVMIVAIITAQLPELHGVADLFGLQEWDYIVMLIVLVFGGAGAASIDRFIRNKAPK
ncbi:DoxX family protein [bacterium]|nr:DoxX family protein [bacterium]